MNLYFDIETIPTQLGWVISDIEANIKPPAALKKQESIDNWIKNEREKAIDEEYRKTALNGNFGQIVSIAWAFDDEDVKSVSFDLMRTGFVNCEEHVLTTFFDEIKGKKITRYVGHNITGFDLPFLLKRSIINSIDYPLPRDFKPWDQNIYDTMIKWDSKKFTSQDVLGKILGLGGKGDVDGSMVWDMAQAGKAKEIESYNRDDVNKVRSIYKRMEML